MEHIVWEDAYSVGIHQIDQDHKGLADLINKFAECAHLGASSERVIDSLTSMLTYAIQHFEREETLFIKHGYPDATNHLASHRKFMERATFASFDAMTGEANIAELLKYLYDWWHAHILHEDMAYKEFLHAQGVS
jgi:hemerythrin-like metal-binding protein